MESRKVSTSCYVVSLGLTGVWGFGLMAFGFGHGALGLRFTWTVNNLPSQDLYKEIIYEEPFKDPSKEPLKKWVLRFWFRRVLTSRPAFRVPSRVP